MKSSRFFSCLAGCFLLIAMIIACIARTGFDHSFYIQLYDRIDLSEQTGVSDQDLQKSIFMMTDYLEGKRDDLNGAITRNGQRTAVFNEKEIRHMKDVRNLWIKARTIMQVFFALWFVISCAILWKKKIAGLYSLLYGLFFAAAGLGLLVFLIWCAVSGGFDDFWYTFHTVIFPGNMDWLLDPATDFMIVICPAEMFSSMIQAIIERVVLSVGFLEICAGIVYKGRGIAKLKEIE